MARLFFGFFFPLLLPQIIANDWVDPCAEPWRRIETRLTALAQAESAAEPVENELRDFALKLRESLSWRLDLHAPGLWVDAKDEQLFVQAPRLPAETRIAGRWLLPRIRLELQARSLFVQAVSFQADRTLRLAAVTLIFADGASVTQRFYDPKWPGQGREISKRAKPLRIAVQPDGAQLPARRLVALEFEGSAQDNHFPANLRFQFLVPDPDASTLPARLREIEGWIRATPRNADNPDFWAELLLKWRELGRSLGFLTSSIN